MSAWYNEHDPFKAEVLREAIKAGAIADGVVDERSIVDVRPDELLGYTQCHFFGGGGFWSLALRLSGWPDDKPVWTGSCPCPSFSVAGKGSGFADPRHLWPEWYRLIRECRPGTVFGEQADGAIGHGWLDLVFGGMEAAKYAIAATVLGAHSAGAPHIRQRLYFVAKRANTAEERLSWRNSRTSIALSPPERNAEQPKLERPRDAGLHANPEGQRRTGRQDHEDGRGRELASGCDGEIGECADTASCGRQRKQERGPAGIQPQVFCEGEFGQQLGSHGSIPGQRSNPAERGLGIDGSAPGQGGYPAQSDATRECVISEREGLEGHIGHVRDWRGPGWLDPNEARSASASGATRGFWADCDWWFGRDGKYRPIGPGIAPLIGAAKSRILSLAHGRAGDLGLLCDHSLPEPETAEARVGRLRMYGDAICVPLAAEFVAASIQALEEIEKP
jgi:DNA (cytosine-5)-methyltransferase 1